MSISDASGQNPLANGANHPGTLALNTTNTYSFAATSGDRIVLRAGAGTYTPRIVVFDPDGVPLAGSTSASSVNRDAEATTQAIVSGTYTVEISSHYGVGSGDYNLRFARIPGEFTVSAGDEGGPMSNGWQHSGTIDVGDLDVWTFMAEAGDSILVRMGGTGFTPLVRLYGPDGALLSASTSNTSVNRDGEASFRATNSGPFTVVASTYYVNGTGPYILSLAKTPGGVVVAPGDTGGPLTNGWQHTGTIDVGDLDVWTFTANAGDNLVVRMGGTGFTPWVRLYGPDGALLSASTSATTANRDGEASFRATNSGPFTVVASAYYINGAGPYILSLAKTPGGVAIAPGDTGGPLTNGWQHTGTIDVGDLDVWTFTANAGDNLVVRMGGTGFTPSVRLYGPDGTLLSASTSATTVNRDGEASFRATNSGTFTVIASAYYINVGGPYLLSLAIAPGDITLAPDDTGGPLTNGWQHSGTIDVGDLDVWDFMANAGDNIVVRMGGTGFTPSVRLYGPDGALLSASTSATTVNREGEASFRATNSGTFTVIASAYYINVGGPYILSLAKAPGEVTAAPGDEGGVLTNGWTIVGTNSVGDLDVWTFFGTLGDSNVFRMVATDFTPWLRLYDPSGALVRDVFAASSVNRSNGFSIVITNEGNYTLVTAARYLNQTGPYSLKQSRVPPDLIVPATQFLNEGATLNVAISAQNPDEPEKLLTFDLISGPPGAALNPLGNTNAAITWVTTEADGPSTNVFVARVTDVVNGTPFIRTNSFTVIVNEINEPPQLTVPGQQTINELTTLNVSALATDPDIPVNALTFSLVNPPAGMTINPNTGAIAWTPTEAQGPSTNTVTVVVTDFNPDAVNEQQLSDTNTFTVIVREVNTPPQLTVPGNQIVDELTPLSVSASATDADLPPNPLIFGLVNPPAGMTINPNTGAIAWTPTEAQGPSVNTIIVVVTDSSPLAVNATQLSTTNSFTVTVREVNTPPQLTVPANQTLDELTPLNVSASATDSDVPVNPLTFSLVSPPAGMTINPNTGAIAWTPTEAQGPSTNVITVVVTDTNAAALANQQLSVTNTFTVTVREVNTAPQLTVPGNQTINELTALNVSASATDSDLPANPLTFSLISPPTGMTIHPNTGAIAWTPTEAQGPSTNVITVVVTDTNAAALANQQLSTTNTFTVTVNEVNHAPQLTVPANQTIDELTSLNVSASATDSDLPANPLTFTLVSPPAGMTINPNTGAIAWTPTEAQGPSTNVITVVVTDTNAAALINQQLSATNTFTVTVNEVNVAPVLTAIADQALSFGFLLSVQAEASDADLPANTLTFSLTTAPTGMTINPSSGLLTWTPAQTQVGTHPVAVRVADNGAPSLSATQTFQVTVTGEGSSLAISRLPANLMQLTITGDIGLEYELLMSTNLTHWSRLLQFNLETSPYPYIDPTSATAPTRFYRLRRLSQ
ncbi:MAG: putative Ig domain-containing protein [Verrucomicrobiae bacterium]|nr:putative Ig domain-containing protein [Verrucomicrobiae bacterium]